MNRLERAALALGVPVVKPNRPLFVKLMALGYVAAQLFLPAGMAHAATFSNARVALSDPQPSATSVTYTTTVSSVTSGNIQCIKAVFSSSPSSAVAIGNGFTAAGASVTAASSSLVNSTSTNWAATPATNQITYVNSGGGITPGTLTGATFVIAGVTNASVANTSYWVFFNTYNNTDCATSPVDNTIVGFIFTQGSQLSLTVDQTLTFTVNAVAGSQACGGGTSTAASTGTTIPFGTVSTAANGLVCQDLTASTNATGGYTIFARYTAAPTNGTGQTIADWTGTTAAPTTFPAAGVTEAYGFTTNDQTLGTGTANRYYNGSAYSYAGMPSSNTEVGYESVGVSSTTYRIAHQVGITALTDPGTYNTTVIYTCTPVY
ncbi:hypothetical protein IPG36_06775 [bacterium]|nr:MAG: hypothetical protein IPG36_06775 [bacterium]